MSNDSTVATRLASAGQRLECMSLLAEMLAGQIERQRRELQAIRSVLAAPVRGQEERGHAAPGNTSLAMLEA
jgi:hypothetical protein